jgi:uncharacterized protein (TIGR03435 family)
MMLLKKCEVAKIESKPDCGMKRSEKCMRSVAVFSILLALLHAHPFQAAAQPDSLLGRPAPTTSLDELLQAPSARLTPELVKGKAVVLEFWATWCGPCIEQIPHLNQLSDAYGNKDVRFIEVTSETDMVNVRRFISLHPMHSWIGIDSAGRTEERYGVKNAHGVVTLPATFVIDRRGRVVFAGLPTELTPAIIQDALNNVIPPRTRTAKPDVQVVNVSQTNADGLTFSLRKSLPSTQFHFEMRKNYVRAEHIPLSMLLELAFQTSEQQIKGNLATRDTYDVVYQLNGADSSPQLLQPILQKALPDVLGIDAIYQTEMAPVFDLRVTDAAKLPPLRNKPGAYHSSGDAISGVITLASLAEVLQRPANRVVVDQTGTAGAYSISLSWKGQDLGVLQQSLSDIGLSLVPDEKQLKFLVVTRRNTN